MCQFEEGGGPTNNGNGNAVSEIDLGDRILKAIAMPPHTAGSTGYLDTKNLMLFTGDALGSSWPYVQGGPLTTYAATVRHVDVVTKPYPGIAVLPAHFYQTLAWGRKRSRWAAPISWIRRRTRMASFPVRKSENRSTTPVVTPIGPALIRPRLSIRSIRFTHPKKRRLSPIMRSIYRKLSGQVGEKRRARESRID